jgi:quercetin 2,3-dioxygenase
MKILRRSQERGFADHGWLKSFHSFSFASYFDERFMGFSDLRVINQDTILGGTGFSTHSHRDMEIISYVLEGSLRHQDSLNNTTIIQPGEVQVMSAGSGVTHSEMNHSSSQVAHFLQIWIHPEAKSLAPSYGQRSFLKELQSNPFTLVVSPTARENSLKIHQDAEVFIGKLKANSTHLLPIEDGRSVWIQMIEGEIELDGEFIKAGDALSVSELSSLSQKRISAKADAHFILFSLRSITAVH